MELQDREKEIEIIKVMNFWERAPKLTAREFENLGYSPTAIKHAQRRLGKEEVISLESLHDTYKENLYVEDTDRIDVVLAVALSNKLEGIPIWLILVGASGDMKSVQLNSLLDLPDVFKVHNLTAKTLVNGYKDKTKFPDLAPELNGKIVLIPDMAQILKLPPVDKAEVWAQLRDLYDGMAGKISGQGSRASYNNLKVSLIAGSTPVIDSQILVHQDLGTRELLYRTSGNKNKDLLIDKCFENEEHEERITKLIRKHTKKFIEGRIIKRVNPSEEVLNEIKTMSKFLAVMRSSGEFDSFTHELRNKVYPEEPSRISKQLKRLYVCLKNLDDNYPEEKALRILWKICFSSCFPIRTALYFLLRLNPSGVFTTSQLAEKIRIGKATVKRECSLLENIGLVKCSRIPTSFPDKFIDNWSYYPSKEIILNNMEKYIYNYTISLDGLDHD